MRTLKIDNFEYELDNDSEVIGIILENKKSYQFALKPNSFSLELVESLSS